MSEAKYQYFCTKCGTTRDSLLDHPAIGTGGYSWNCPRCNGPVDSREIVVSEAPKKIWVGGTEEAHGDWGTIDVYPEDIPYIREDVVLELVKALETNSYEPGCNCDECKEIRDVIHKIKEESHD